jgi:hypothetical protein
MGRRGHRVGSGGNMVALMSEDIKYRIAELERQKIELEDRLETLGYSANLVRMHEIEEQIFEIEDTIQKLVK